MLSRKPGVTTGQIVPSIGAGHQAQGTATTIIITTTIHGHDLGVAATTIAAHL